ncbi:MAG: site-specific integrase [Planctomycetota bacterium]|nr:MAG: site-specific integrase [Planctomycetota bacterium]
MTKIRSRGTAGKSNLYAIDFVWPAGAKRPEGQPDRPRIRLGQVTKRQAEEVCRNVESLLASRVLNQPPRVEVAEWLSGVSGGLYAKLEAKGLVDPREPAVDEPSLRLRQWCGRFLRQRRVDVKPRTIQLYRHTIRGLNAHFPSNPSVESIGPGDAVEWRTRLKGRGLSEATVRQHCRHAKAIFNAAVDAEVIGTNPFRKLPSRSIAANRDTFVDHETADRVIAELPDIAWRMLFGLARYAGLRVPSETHRLTWADVDWERARLRVYAPKTNSERMVPICQNLYPLLVDGFEAAAEHESRVVSISCNNMPRTLHAAIRRAGVEVWPDTFQTLRRSCESDLAKVFPQHAVSAWLGHSVQVSQEHYLQVTEDLFGRAAQFNGAEAQQKAQQHGGAPRVTPVQGIKTETGGDCRGSQDDPSCKSVPCDANPRQMGGLDYESPALTAELQGHASSSIRHGPRPAECSS